MNASSPAARAFGAAAVSLGLLAVNPAQAGAAISAPPSQAALEAEAQQISGQIEAEGHQLDILGEQYNGAVIRLQQLTTEEAQVSVAMATTDRAVDATRSALKDQALMAYVTGGGPLTPYASSSSINDATVKAAYAEIIAAGEKRAVASYRAALALQGRQAAQLAGARAQAAITLRDIRSDQTAADTTLAAQRQALSQVKGQLAVLVAQAQAARQRAEQAAVQASLASQRQPAPAPTPTTAPPVTRPPTTRGPTPSVPASTTTTTVPPAPPSGPNSPAPGAQLAINYARAQLGKPYQWGGAGPDSFDCSGLTMMAWEQAGVYFPHLAQDQYDMTTRVAIPDLLPGDLVFYGTPDNVYHVGLYIGNGQMIDAPATGQFVSIQSIYWDGLLAGGRVSA